MFHFETYIKYRVKVYHAVEDETIDDKFIGQGDFTLQKVLNEENQSFT